MTPSATSPLADLSPALRDTAEGVVLAVLVQPKARKDEIVGLVDGRLKVRLAAPPVEGKANQALTDFLAGKLKLPRSKVRIVGGEKSRRKDVLVAGAGRDSLAELLSFQQK